MTAIISTNIMTTTINKTICPLICLLIHLSIQLSVCLCVLISICFLCLSVHLFIYLSLSSCDIGTLCDCTILHDMWLSSIHIYMCVTDLAHGIYNIQLSEQYIQCMKLQCSTLHYRTVQPSTLYYITAHIVHYLIVKYNKQSKLHYSTVNILN